MKAVMVTTFPLEPDCIVGGVGGVSVYLTRELARIEGLSLEVIAFDSPVLAERTRDFEGVPVHYLPRAVGCGPIVRRVWATPAAVKRKLCELDFDLVHVQAVARIAQVLDCPRVLTIHGIPERDQLFRRWGRLRSLFVKTVERPARRRIGNVIVISPYVRTALAGQLRGRTWDIENPVADHFFDVQRRPVPGRVLFGGLIVPRKNILGLLRAFAIVASDDPQTELRLAGHGADSAYGRQCLHLASRLGVAERVRFLGPLPVEELKKEMAQAWSLVLCSFQETAPVIIEEAMAVGVPVVASNICGIPYMVADGQTGVLVNPADPADIARGLLSVLQAEDAEAMSARSRQIANERFRASVVAHKTYEVYQQVLLDSRP